MKKGFHAYGSFFKNRLCQLTIFLMLAGFVKHSTAQNIRLVKDINTSTDANPSNYNSNIKNYTAANFFVVLNGISYFSADDGINGRGLWRTDGTPAGTYQVKAGINPSNIIVSNGKLLFSSSGPLGLWKSDGTDAGTVPVLNVMPTGLSIFVPGGLIDFNGTAFFALTNPSAQLWKTDGTANGTVLVKDLNVNSNFYFNPNNFAVVKNKLYFSATTSADFQTSRLWVTDGSTTGTYIVSNTIAEPAQFIAGSVDVSNPFVYFTASSSQNGLRSLYVTTGVANVAGITAGFAGIITNNYNQQDLINIGGTIYFIGKNNSGSPNTSLYKYTVANGTQPVKIVTGVNSNGFGSGIFNIAQVNGVLFFTLNDAVNNKAQLWKSDGTSLGNILIKDNFSGNILTNINGQLYFNGRDPINGVELWKSDGTANGTVIVKDINPGANGSNPGSLSFLNNKILFAANDGVNGTELWQSDGTTTGTLLLKDMNQAATVSSAPQKLKTFNSQVVFLAKDGNTNNRDKFWKSDGTSIGTTTISDSIYGEWFWDFFPVKDQVYFWGYTISNIGGLFKTNGEPNGTILVKDFTGLQVGFAGAKATNNLVYFILQTPTGYELWRTDGTEANTFIIKNDFSQNIDISNFLTAGNLLFFNINNNLWKTDGSIAGTVLIKSFASVTKLTEGDGVLYFNAYEGGVNSIWKSDGTTAGTVKVTANVTNAVPLIYAGSNLFFTGTGNTGTYGDLGNELFKTDGTANGTFLVKDIVAGNASSSVGTSVFSNGKLYFTTYGNSGIELWKSDGTAAGTSLIINIGNNGPSGMVICNGKLFFMINDYANQTFLLWESDGTAAGTHPVTDNLLAKLKLDYGANLAAVGNLLFFRASNYQFGQELYVADVSGPPANDSFSLCPNGSGGITSNLVGTNYQWQFKADTAATFSNLAEDSTFTGVTTSTMQVKNIPSSYAGAKFRCQVNGNTFSKITTLTFAVNWTGNLDNNWNNTGNWGCGGLLPDANTNVVVNYGQVIVNTNATCRTIYVKPGASVVVNTGFTLSVIGN